MTVPPALLAALLLLAGPDPADPAGWFRQGVLGRLNRERAAAGLRPLALDDRLVRVAQQEAEEIARRGFRAYEEAALRETFRHTRHRLARAAYEPHGWSESWALGGGATWSGSSAAPTACWRRRWTATTRTWAWA